MARPYSERPPRAAYELTAEGKELAGALRLLAHWGARHADPVAAPRHPACGTPLEIRWYCPTCDRLADAEASPGSRSRRRSGSCSRKAVRTDSEVAAGIPPFNDGAGNRGRVCLFAAIRASMNEEQQEDQT